MGPLTKSSTKHQKRSTDVLTEEFHDFSEVQGDRTSTKQKQQAMKENEPMEDTEGK